MANRRKVRATKRGAAGGVAAAVAMILAAVFAAEGGFVDHPSDPGGATNHGITQRTARANGYAGDMRALTREEAEAIYVRQYIERPGLMPLVAIDPWLAEETVDSGVNAGPGRAARWLQESLNHLNRRGRDYPDIAEDGAIGPQTLRALEALRARRGARRACVMVLRLMDAKQAGHYARLGGRNAKFEDFMPGWIDTRIENVDRARCGTGTGEGK